METSPQTFFRLNLKFVILKILYRWYFILILLVTEHLDCIRWKLASCEKQFCFWYRCLFLEASGEVTCRLEAPTYSDLKFLCKAASQNIVRTPTTGISSVVADTQRAIVHWRQNPAFTSAQGVRVLTPAMCCKSVWIPHSQKVRKTTKAQSQHKRPKNRTSLVHAEHCAIYMPRDHARHSARVKVVSGQWTQDCNIILNICRHKVD
jgi:hypothetical protein